MLRPGINSIYVVSIIHIATKNGEALNEVNSNGKIKVTQSQNTLLFFF
jgi:hypothetical protein